MEWFAPHFEFRFPRLGDFTQRDITVQLRGALEPWHVLGEEDGPGGAVRYVDSSVERLQVKVTGMIADRFAITCNGRRVPIHPTGINGEFVAGVRYRAWCPPECLHPTIGVHAPLVFDLYDTWNERSLGGCTYHVTHPGGLSYSTFPINAYEAESRRLSRFLVQGHSQRAFYPAEGNREQRVPFHAGFANRAAGKLNGRARSEILDARLSSNAAVFLNSDYFPPRSPTSGDQRHSGHFQTREGPPVRGIFSPTAKLPLQHPAWQMTKSRAGTAPSDLSPTSHLRRGWRNARHAPSFWGLFWAWFSARPRSI